MLSRWIQTENWMFPTKTPRNVFNLLHQADDVRGTLNARRHSGEVRSPSDETGVNQNSCSTTIVYF